MYRLDTRTKEVTVNGFVINVLECHLIENDYGLIVQFNPGYSWKGHLSPAFGQTKLERERNQIFLRGREAQDVRDAFEEWQDHCESMSEGNWL